jgi:hypothetical protein
MLKQITIVAIALAVTTVDAQADPDAVRRENEQKLLRAAQEDDRRRELEEKRAEAVATYEKEQAEERRRQAKTTKEREAHRLRLVRETRCQFKPVMTDDDIARCREVYR